MEILKRKKGLIIRFIDLVEKDFILEHKRIIEQEGYVWMGKIGKIPSPKRMHKLILDKGYILLVSNKKSGNKCYLCNIDQIKYEEPDDYIYPIYYTQEHFNIGDIKVWFKLTYISKEYEPNILGKFICSCNQQSSYKVLNNTRTSYMYVESIEHLYDL